MKTKNRFTFLFLLIAYALVLFIGIYVIPGSEYVESLRAGFKMTIPKLVLYGVLFYGLCGALAALIFKVFRFRKDGKILILMTFINVLSIIITSVFTDTVVAIKIIPYLKWFYGMYFINFGLVIALFDKTH